MLSDIAERQSTQQRIHYSVNEHIRGARILFQPETITDPSTHKKSKKLIQGMKFKSSVGLVNPEEIPADDGTNP